VCILRGDSTNVSKIDGEYFQYETLAGWTEKATLVSFNYHALLLYISVLLDDSSTGMKAIENCAKTVKGVKGNFWQQNQSTRSIGNCICIILGSNHQTPSVRELERQRLGKIRVPFELPPPSCTICTKHIPTQSSLPRRSISLMR
jgi:hypothetical protein